MNNDEKTIIKCSQCGTNLSEKANFCTICGYNFITKQSRNSEYPGYTIGSGTKNNNNKKIFLIVTSINFTVILPVVAQFSIFWLLFGGLSGDIPRVTFTLALCTGYCVASVFGLIAAIISMTTKYGGFRRGFFSIIIGFLIGILLAFYIV